MVFFWDVFLTFQTSTHLWTFLVALTRTCLCQLGAWGETPKVKWYVIAGGSNPGQQINTSPQPVGNQAVEAAGRCMKLHLRKRQAHIWNHSLLPLPPPLLVRHWGPLCYSNNKFFGVEIRVTANRGYMPLMKQMECLDIFLNSRLLQCKRRTDLGIVQLQPFLNCLSSLDNLKLTGRKFNSNIKKYYFTKRVAKAWN